MKKDIDRFIESLREIEDRFGTTQGILRAIPNLPVRKSDRIIRTVLMFLFHKFLLRIQTHLVEDYYLKGVK